MTDAIAGRSALGDLSAALRSLVPAAGAQPGPDSPPPPPGPDAGAYHDAQRQSLGRPGDSRQASAAAMAVRHVDLDEGGDLVAGALEALGRMTQGLPTFRPCWENAGWQQDLDPERVKDQAQSNARTMQACLDEGATTGVHLGAGARRVFPRLSFERVAATAPPVPAVPPPPAAPSVRPALAIAPLAALTLPTVQPVRVQAEMGHRFGSDCATFYGTVPPAVRGVYQTTLQQLARGEGPPLAMQLTSLGAVRLGWDGKAQAVGREAPSYDAVDGRPGNGALTRQALERARSVKAELRTDAQGQVLVRVTASCDEVQSRLSVDHLRAPGREVLQRLLQHRQVTCAGRPVRLTDNDGLAAMRVLAAGIKLQRAAYLEAILGDSRLGAAERRTLPPGEGGSWAPDLFARLQAGTLSEDQAVLAAMARPALQRVIGKPPAVQLQRLGADGKAHPLLVPESGTGRLVPLTLSVAQGITLLASQTVAKPPGRQAIARTQSTADGGGVALAALTAALDSPGANAVGLSGCDAPQDLGVPLGPGEDPQVVALLAHVDDGADVSAIRQSNRQVQADLRHVAGLCRQGVLTGGLSLQAQRAVAVAIETFLQQPDAPGLADCRERVLHMAGAGPSAPFARALVRRLQAGCRLEMALRALPAERRQLPPGTPTSVSSDR